jgi:hypothetical protein
MKYRVPDALFPSDNEYGIPNLRIERQADFADLPIRGWGSVARKNRMRGTWHFYVDDDKFKALWKHPASVLETRCIGAVEPNFSTDDQMPLAVAVYRIYQKRWLARYWQQYELPVWVDLYVAPPFYKLNLMGVPEGWRSYATSATDARLDLLREHASLAKEHAGMNPIRFMVYGGGRKVKELCGKNDWIHVPEARNSSRKLTTDK